MRTFLLAAAVCVTAAGAYWWISRPVCPADTEIAAEDAAKCVGAVKTICGRVSGTTYIPETRGQPTFVDIGPNVSALAYIDRRSEVLALLPDPLDTCICMTGTLKTYDGRTQIEVRKIEQLVVTEHRFCG